MGTVTDCKIAIKDGKSRRFCFIGIKIFKLGYKTP